jgi:hypothetical protein
MDRDLTNKLIRKLAYYGEIQPHIGIEDTPTKRLMREASDMLLDLAEEINNLERQNLYLKGAAATPLSVALFTLSQEDFGVEKTSETIQPTPKRDLMKGLWKV